MSHNVSRIEYQTVCLRVPCSADELPERFLKLAKDGWELSGAELSEGISDIELVLVFSHWLDEL